MEIIGLIAEYNPFHNGHLYQINEIKKRYPNSIIVLILNGYFLERGLVSLESKEEKTKLALKYGIDIVIELPFIFGSNSADIFADASLELLNELKITKLIFGSESDDIKFLMKAASYQLSNSFNKKVKELMKQGINYPTALNKANIYQIKEPNDLLGISYIKAILKNKYPITCETIKRTNDFHDIKSNDEIISASNIRKKIEDNISIDKYIPEGKINKVNYDLLFTLLKYKIITEHHLDEYLTVDEGIDYRLKKVINDVNSLDELVDRVKTKRYTYNRILRMCMHILVGLKKKDKLTIKKNEYIRFLGMNQHGKKYINSIKKAFNLPIYNKKYVNTISRQYELKTAYLYQILTDDLVLTYEKENKISE